MLQIVGGAWNSPKNYLQFNLAAILESSFGGGLWAQFEMKFIFCKVKYRESQIT